MTSIIPTDSVRRTVHARDTSTHGSYGSSLEPSERSTKQELGNCLKMLCGEQLPAKVFNAARETVLEDFVLARVRLSEPASLGRAFAELENLLYSYDISGPNAAKVMTMLRKDTKKVLAGLINAIIDPDEANENHAPGLQADRRRSAVEPSPLSTECSGAQQNITLTENGLRSDKLGSFDNPTASRENAITSRHEAGDRSAKPDHEIQDDLYNTNENGSTSTPARSVGHSLPSSAPLRSRFFYSGSETDIPASAHSTVAMEQSDDDESSSPTRSKPKKRVWSNLEEATVLQGMKSRRPSHLIVNDLAKNGIIRTATAIENRRAFLRKKYPKKRWTYDTEDTTALRRSSKVTSFGGFNLSSGPGPVRCASTVTRIAWVSAGIAITDFDTHVLFLPMNTPELPMSPDSADSILELEQACLEAFKGGERSFQSVERLAEDFWVVKCRTPQFGFRELLECPIVYHGITFFAEYLPLQAPKTFAAEVQDLIQECELIQAMQSAFTAFEPVPELALQSDEATSTRMLIAYFVKAPMLMRLYVPLRSGISQLCFKPVETFGTCWLCRKDHGDQRCSIATTLTLDAESSFM